MYCLCCAPEILVENAVKFAENFTSEIGNYVSDSMKSIYVFTISFGGIYVILSLTGYIDKVNYPVHSLSLSFTVYRCRLKLLGKH